ncbi:MAG TPA: hypothetical protein DDZ41_08790, partial [Flavobacterium sp.]|nr:hypothetical protein [Flavobacterium sp.]
KVNSFKIYSLIDAQKQAIQGRPAVFDESDIVPLGFFITSEGSYTLAISAVDGLFLNTSQNIFLEDKQLNIIHNLKQSPYCFSSTAGEFNNRFILRYSQNVLSTSSMNNPKNIIINTQNKVSIKTINELKTIIVYDMLGRNIYKKDEIFSNEITLENFFKTNEPLIVMAFFINGEVISTKMIY